MAKWGEGDPRWIVEERPDATNVSVQLTDDPKKNLIKFGSSAFAMIVSGFLLTFALLEF